MLSRRIAKVVRKDFQVSNLGDGSGLAAPGTVACNSVTQSVSASKASFERPVLLLQRLEGLELVRLSLGGVEWWVCKRTLLRYGAGTRKSVVQ